MKMIPDFQVGDLVRYSWNEENAGVVLEINHLPLPPYLDSSSGQLYLKLLWNKLQDGKDCWWVPIDRWVVKLT